MGDDSRYIEFSGTYPANELYVTESRNEDGCRELIYTDKEGKKILARSMNGTEKIDTYFVYDFAGRLAVVITPEGTNEATIQNYKSIAISSAFVDTYCYYYHYDSRGSVTTKHIPGGAYEEMNYDSYCRLWRRWRGAQNTYWDEKYLEQYSYDQLNRIKEVSILVMPISAGITSSTYTRNPVTMSAYIYDNYKGVPAALDESSNPAFVANPRGEKTYEKLLLLESNTQIAVLSYYTERAFYYDKEGRLRRCVELNHRGGRSTIDYEYDFQGHTTRRTERIQPLTNAPVDVLDIRYTYDHVGRLLTQTSTLNTSDPVTVTCTYNELGQLERKNINGLIMDYTYNLQGWLIGQDSPYYSAKLKYYDGEYPSYAGNITEWTWGGAGTMPHTYKYRYDNLARMTGAWYSGDEGAQNYSERAIAYDDNGNILRMVRNQNDQLAYTYKGNQLQSVNNEKFEYDNCGNIIKDERNDLNITYNFLNLPWQVYRISNPSDRTLYSYLPDGTKLSSVDQTGNGLYYVGSLVYTGGRTTARLESAGFGDGRFRATTSSGRCLPEYYLTDHLGSIRALCDHTGELIALRDYYAFGMEWVRPNAPATTDRYYYNGKEKQEIGNTGLLDYGARFYNPDIGRWTTLDPMAEKYSNISPYAYCGGNPIKRIDPDGKQWVDAKNRPMWSNGQYTQYATKDFIRASIAARATETGRAAFNIVANSSSKVQFEISPDVGYKPDANGNPTTDMVRGLAVYKKNSAKILPNGEIVADCKIIIYEGSIKKQLNGEIESSGEIADLIKSFSGEKYAVEIGIGSVMVHEANHQTQENLKQNAENTAAGKFIHDVEAKPTEAQRAHLNEYRTYIDTQKPR